MFSQKVEENKGTKIMREVVKTTEDSEQSTHGVGALESLENCQKERLTPQIKRGQ